MAISTHSIRSSAATAWETDGAVVIFRAGHVGFGPKARAVDQAIGGAAGRAASAPRFSGKSGDCIDILAPAGLKARRVVVLDVGDPAALTALSASRAGSSLARHLENEGEQTALVLFETPAGAALAGNDLLAQILLGIRLRNYRFGLMARTEKAFDLTLTLEHDEAEAMPLVRSEAVADGVALARTLVNYPASHLNPDNFADYLEPLQAAGIAVEVLDKAELERLGMGAILAVGNGSARGPRVIVLRYKGAEGQPLALVGKGMCFDAGGLCIKTGPQMFTMKGDMGGAAAVIGAMLALARQKAAVHVVGVLGVAENMLSGSSYKPGDIVTTMSGRTVEVFDTDCEGRMVLADVLHYTATRFQPKAIVDLATLTYSVMRGLGHAFAGLFATHDELANGLLAAGEATGERFWRLPLDPAYEENLISPIADLRQHGRDLEDGDAPVAAAFLKTFAEGVPYVHLDIAGKELIDQDRLHARVGGAGFGVQLLEEWITSGAAAKFRG